MTVACSKSVVKPENGACNCPPAVKQPIETPPVKKPTTEKPPADISPYSLLKPASWQDLDGLLEDDVVADEPVPPPTQKGLFAFGQNGSNARVSLKNLNSNSPLEVTKVLFLMSFKFSIFL